MSIFIHLRTFTDYSLGEGIIKIKELVAKAKELKMPALAVVDRHNLFGSLEFSLECLKNGIQPIIGCTLKVDYSTFISQETLGSFSRRKTKYIAEMPVLVKSAQGHLNLLKLLTDSYITRGKSEEGAYVTLEELFTLNEGLILLCGAVTSPISKLYLTDGQLENAKNLTKSLLETFRDRFYLEINRHLSSLEGQQPIEEAKAEAFVKMIATEYNIPLVAANQVSFLTPDMYEAQDAILCIAHGRYITEEDRIKASPEHYFKTQEQMAELFSDIPEAITNTEIIARRCAFWLNSNPPLLPKFMPEGSTITEEEELSRQAQEGLEAHLKLVPAQEHERYFQRLKYELEIITKMEFSGYFLIVSDFIKWSKKQGIPVGPGRGSGAGSLVAWSLQITDLDPIKFGLLFERFLNPERVSMPDFDIDFCQERRDEVIDYVRTKYGDERVAAIITFGKLQPRIVLRDVGRVLQMEYFVVDRICKMVPNNPANPITLKEAIDMDKALQESSEEDPIIAKLLDIGLKLEGTNRHVSTHAAGIVIADRPLRQLVPLYLDNNSHIPAVQYSMKYAESVGLVKFDFLGLKTLTAIAWACNLVRQREIELDINTISLDDTKTYDLLSQGNTFGIFQFEGAGMRDAIKKLKPSKIEDLIALGSLYRPGPMDNIPSYIRRKHGLETPEYPHPKLEEILKETYGIIVYQEQVMQIAQVLAGYSLGAADLLRRAMGKKIKAEMAAQSENFINGAVQNGVERNKAQEIFELVDKFASYGFNKSHAAAYALISYQTAYLKAHYPLEFFTASMNLDLLNTDKLNMYCHDAKTLGIEILPPDINSSSARFVIEGGKIRYGLAAIKNVQQTGMEGIVIERERGKFKDIYDFASRCYDHINKKSLVNLAQAGVFDSLGENRRGLVDNLQNILQYAASERESKESDQMQLADWGFAFEEDPTQEVRKSSSSQVADWDAEEKLNREFEALGFYLTAHPIAAYQKQLLHNGVHQAYHVDGMLNETRFTKLKLAGVITSFKVKSSNRGKYAFIQMSDPSGIIELSIFDEQLLEANKELLETGRAVLCEADGKKEPNGNRIIINKVLDLHQEFRPDLKHLKVEVLTPNAVAQLKMCLKEAEAALSSKKTYDVVLCGRVNGYEVAFSTSDRILLDTATYQKLQNIKDLQVAEYQPEELILRKPAFPFVNLNGG
jgi:DNA polymerase-3 subunit alpha